MTTVNPGTGGTLKAVKAEGMLLELLTFIKLQELQPSRNPNNRTNVNISYNLGTQLANISFTIDAVPQINTSGQMITVAGTYLQNTGFIRGTSGTFVSTTPEACLIELLSFIQIRENDPTKNINNENNIAFTFDADRSVFSGSITLPIDTSISTNGNIAVAAREYLRD